MPLKPQPLSAKKRSDAMVKALRGTFLRSPTIIVIRKATTLEIVSSQKTSCNLDNLYVDNY